jgi:hypothetical protein
LCCAPSYRRNNFLQETRGRFCSVQKTLRLWQEVVRGYFITVRLQLAFRRFHAVRVAVQKRAVSAPRPPLLARRIARPTAHPSNGCSRPPDRPFTAGRPRNASKRWQLYRTLTFFCCTGYVERVPWRHGTRGPSLHGRPGHRGRRRVWAWTPPCAPAAGPGRPRKSGMSPFLPVGGIALANLGGKERRKWGNVPNTWGIAAVPSRWLGEPTRPEKLVGGVTRDTLSIRCRGAECPLLRWRTLSEWGVLLRTRFRGAFATTIRLTTSRSLPSPRARWSR